MRKKIAYLAALGSFVLACTLPTFGHIHCEVLLSFWLRWDPVEVNCYNAGPTCETTIVWCVEYPEQP